MLNGCTPWPEEFVDRYWAAGHWRGNALDNLLRGWALQYGPRTALVHAGTRIPYAALNRRVSRMAAGFRLRGLRPGQRVVVQLPNVPEFVVTVFALMRAGAVPVFCPVSYRASEVSHLVRVAQAVGYVGPSTYQGFDHTVMAADIAAREPFLRRVFTLEAPGVPSPYGGLTTDPSGCQYSPLGSIDAPPEPALAQSADQVAFFLLSGGTGAAPNLVPRTHNDYAYQARAAAELVSLTENDVYLAAQPAESNFAFGCPGIVGTLSVGGTVVLVENPGPAECLPAIERERVTITSVVPAVARLWLDALPTVRAGPSSLRLVQIGGALLHRTTAERMGPALGCRLQQVFGMAEGLLTRVAATLGAATETMLGLKLLRDCAVNALPFRPWHSMVRGRLGTGTRPVTSLLAVDGPDIDLTMLMGDTPSIEEGIDNLLRASPDRIRTELEHIDFHPSQLSWARTLAEGDLEARRHFAAGLAACNEAIIAPYWSRARTHMEGVRNTFARTLLDGGVERLLEGMCVPLVRWRAPVLEMRYHRNVEVRLGGRGLVIAPTVFLWRDAALLWDPLDGDSAPTLAIPTIGDAEAGAALWGAGEAADQSLGALLGRTRAAALRVATEGCSTTELARRLNVSVAAASQHATVLRNANLITTSRRGKSVVHTITPLGAELLGGEAAGA
ncbi:AMP-binding protein [Streptomyces sp. NPDC006463]|uniref:AMP-binding protein n=1 Tax=Streptomyces sp. NPDC006463 TaxID=3364746 RepID=UPI0036CA90A2